MLTIGEVLDQLSRFPRDAAFSVSVDVSVSEHDMGHRAHASEMSDCFASNGGNVTLCLIGELNGDDGHVANRTPLDPYLLSGNHNGPWLGTRAYNCLRSSGVKYLEDVSEDAICLNTRGCGQKTITEILAWRDAVRNALAAGTFHRDAATSSR